MGSEELNDLELRRTEQPTPLETPPNRTGLWVAGGAVVLLAAVAIYVTLARRPLPPAATNQPPPAAVTQPPRSLGGEAESVVVPPLDESDQVVRTLVRALSTHEAVVAWLATKGLIRTFTLAVTNIADGASPAKQMVALRSATPFRPMDSNGRLYVDPGSYDRYTRVADAVQSIDPAGAARLYATLKPRIEEAFGDLGFPDRKFDRVLEQAIVALLRTPVPDGRLPLQPSERGIGYAFSDPRLEDLSPAQKALVRMGPRNARVVKQRLRDIALALGIAPSALPAADRPTPTTKQP